MAKATEEDKTPSAQGPPSSGKGGGIKAEGIRLGVNLISDDIIPLSRRPRHIYSSNLFHHVLSILFGWTGAGTKMVGVRDDGALRVYDEKPLPTIYPVDIKKIGGVDVGSNLRVTIGRRVIRLTQSFTQSLAPDQSDVWVVGPDTGKFWRLKEIEVNGGSASGATSGNQSVSAGVGSPYTEYVRAIWPYDVTPAVWCNEPVNAGTPTYPSNIENWSNQIRNLQSSSGMPIYVAYRNGTNGTVTATRTITLIIEEEDIG